MNTTALPGQLIKCRGMSKQKRSNLAANPGTQYKIVPLQIAIPANIDDAMITDALNWVLSSLELMEGPIAHDWQFLARNGAVGDNDHFREAIIDEDDLFANTPQSIFENWYLIPEGVQCPQCEKFFTAPEDIATIGDHALCTACLTAWRMTAAGSAGSPTDTTNGDNGDGYSEQPPFLPIPEWWAARGLEAPITDGRFNESASHDVQQYPISSDEYSKTGGPRCPNCGRKQTEGGPVDVEGATATQKITCTDCNATWYDMYALVGYDFIDYGTVPVACPQCNQIVTGADAITIADHGFCHDCRVAWRKSEDERPEDNAGYSEQPPFLPIPEWWAARGMETPTDDEADNKEPPLTIDQVKEALPDVQVESRGKVYTAKVRGRRNPFAEVSWDTDCGIMYADFAWQTVTNAINNNKVLKA